MNGVCKTWTDAAAGGWIVVSVWATASGWILSWAGHLNPAGYGLLLTLSAGLLAYGVRRTGVCKGLRLPPVRKFCRLRRIRSIRSALPWAFALLLAGSLLGGLLYHPNNYDFLTYRFSRLLHWWWEGGWHWIETPNERMNYSGAGAEWLLMPLFQFSHSDRLFFLTNWLPFLLMPGLVFSVFRHAGTAPRMAWLWM